MFESLNKKRTVMDGVDTQDMEYRKLKEFKNQTLRVKGFFFTESSMSGKQVVVVGEDYLINMPKRAIEQFETILNTPEMLNAVLNGELSIAVHDEQTTRGGNKTILYELVG